MSPIGRWVSHFFRSRESVPSKTLEKVSARGSLEGMVNAAIKSEPVVKVTSKRFKAFPPSQISTFVPIKPLVQEEVNPEKESTTEKTAHVGKQQFKKIAEGAAKEVWKRAGIKNKVYLTPKRGLLGFWTLIKKAEIKSEMQKVKDIQYKLIHEQIPGINKKDALRLVNHKEYTLEGIKKMTKESLASILHSSEEYAEKVLDELVKLDLSEKHLALDMREASLEERIDQRFTIVTPRATGNFEDDTITEGLSFSLSLGLQLLSGMKDLHGVGYVHGDLKPENLLKYSTIDGVRLKVADFGKARQLRFNKDSLYAGNPRYAAPEGRLSMRGEVYSTALIIIRFLEQELLDKEKPMLLEPGHADTKVKLGEKNGRPRLGIERFLILNQNSPQTEVLQLRGKFKVYGREIRQIFAKDRQDYTWAEQDTQLYIDELIAELSERYQDQDDQLKEVGDLLKEMVQSDPSKRPSMNEAFVRFKEATDGLIDTPT
ncbi:MAG: protein kinase domain-containing protein [Parachlamydiaceae bacterium]